MRSLRSIKANLISRMQKLVSTFFEIIKTAARARVYVSEIYYLRVSALHDEKLRAPPHRARDSYQRLMVEKALYNLHMPFHIHSFGSPTRR
jgi:hypothetical protein